MIRTLLQLKSAAIIIVIAAILLLNTACSTAQGVRPVSLTPLPGKAVAAFAEGCFWHAEIVFESVKGVDSAVSGYAGGHKKNPSYEDVTSETTGHTETVLVYYDPNIISYNELIQVFFASVDPTTKDRQGNDVGSSYRSAIFYGSPAESEIAKKAISTYEKSGRWKRPIVTEVLPLNTFYRAEQYHQNYIAHNPTNSYVCGVSIPEYKHYCPLIPLYVLTCTAISLKFSS